MCGQKMYAGWQCLCHIIPLDCYCRASTTHTCHLYADIYHHHAYYHHDRHIAVHGLAQLHAWICQIPCHHLYCHGG